jgi:hypothetical protein
MTPTPWSWSQDPTSGSALVFVHPDGMSLRALGGTSHLWTVYRWPLGTGILLATVLETDRPVDTVFRRLVQGSRTPATWDAALGWVVASPEGEPVALGVRTPAYPGLVALRAQDLIARAFRPVSVDALVQDFESEQHRARQKLHAT